jgi:phosphate transport system substrate-binding protein
MRVGLAIGTALTAALALSSCASNEGTPASSSSASGGAGSSASASALTGTLNAQGSSAQTNAQTAWTKAFQTTNSGATVNYNPTGSGAGRTAFESGGADFAGSDAALPAAELSGGFKECKAGTKGIDIPVYVSPVALVYNLDGVKTLNLDGRRWRRSSPARSRSGTTRRSPR